ncbi:MAG TPA: carboxypeptidase regulatory-like domain-containing protein [Pseudonocardiaceae bacterium]|nr:carboxypeptidase regulatory-like domain-containing protein [Pseudonocardiaceae bacterium]
MTFAYGPHSEPVLRDLSLTVPPGDHLAIVGPSGIGKSTLAGLLCGLLRPNSGTVKLGGAIAADLPPERLAEMRTLIPQEAYVFAGPAWDNLTYLCPTATTRQVANAVAALGADMLLAKLGGFAAELVPAELSAGERQLIALVRAYISAAQVIVLDEATCHLDPAAERRVEEAFSHRGGTLIVIAHRVSSALRARRILVLDGTNAAVGDHLTLMSTSPLYRELFGHWHAAPTESAEKDAHLVAVRLKRSRASRQSREFSSVDFASRKPYELPGNRLDLTMGERMGSVAELALEESIAPTPSLVPAKPVPLPAPPAAVPPGPSPDAPASASNRNGQMQESASSSALWRRRRRGRREEPFPAPANPASEANPTEPNLPASDAAMSTPPAAAEEVARPEYERRLVIFGQVSEQGNVALPGAKLTLTDLSGRQLDRDMSDSGGHYQLGPPTGGSYLVICASAAHQPTAALVAVAQAPVRHDVVLVGAGASLSGTVLTAETGQPIENAMVTLVDVQGDVVATTSTEAEGRFSFSELAQGSYTLTVAAPSLQPVARSVEVPSAGHVTYDVEVAARVQLVGVVRTATTGVPVPEALATLVAPDGQVIGSVITDSEGRFVFDDLSAGLYTVIATGYPPAAAEVEVGAGASTETMITLRPPTLGSVPGAEAAVGNGVAHSTEQEVVKYGEQ